MGDVQARPSVIDLMDSTGALKDEPASALTDDRLRRWLMLLRQPDRLGEDGEISSLLEMHGRRPAGTEAIDIGRAAAALLSEAIAGLEPPPDGPAEQRL